MAKDLSEEFTRHWTQAQPVVARYVSAVVPDFNQAEDILQEVAVVLLRRFAEYRHDSPFAAWAIGIAKNKILATHRARPVSCLVGCPDILDSVAAACDEIAPEADRRARALRECMKRLEKKPLELLELRYERALKPREIAAQLGVQAGAIRTSLTRVRGLLQDCIERRLAGQESGA